MRIRKFTILFLLACLYGTITMARGHSIRGVVVDAKTNETLPGASILLLSRADSVRTSTITDTSGAFCFSHLPAGKYHVRVTYIGYTVYRGVVKLIDANVDIGQIKMIPYSNTLNEVKIVEKILAVTQKGDTTEFNTGAYQTSPDADAADLVKKMPGIALNGKNVSAQGETVTKVLIDGRPFFGNDPYASLKNLPADIIAKVQVYNEKGEQEQFTGFNEGKTTKTINIITKPGKRNGIFGRLSAGYGNDENQNSGRYAVGGNMNRFDGKRRFSITAQSNNVNIQNFSSQDLTGIQGIGGAGITTINSGGLNYSDSWGKKINVSASYFFDQSNGSSEMDATRQYVLSTDSGQVYNEASTNKNNSYDHRINMRINYKIDSMNSILLMPQLSLQKNYAYNTQVAHTRQEDSLLNATVNGTKSDMLGYNFTNTFLYRHRFYKRGRTFSVNINSNNDHNSGISYLNATNTFFSDSTLSSKLNQRSNTYMNSWSVSGNMAYTEPVGEHGMVQVQYNLTDQPGRSERNAYNYSDSTQNYDIADTSLSNTFNTRNWQQKGGASYQYYTKKYNFSVGLYYQSARLINKQELPYPMTLEKLFNNFMPNASFHYRFSDRQNIQLNYNTSTFTPAVTQLQDVIDNTNPLHLSSGNPDLKQPYTHNVIARYYVADPKRGTNLSILLSGSYTENHITSNTIIAQSDTEIRHNVKLPKGSQLTMPVNVQGTWNMRANVSYGMPLKFMKCNLNLDLSGGLMRMPGIINGEMNYDDRKTAGANISVSSNISENLDFTFSSMANINSDKNSLNANLDNLYFNMSHNFTFNWIFWRGFLFNTTVSYQHNSGLSDGFNQDYTLWNLSIGKKLFKKHQGDIRLTGYDILSQNNNIQHVVTETYIADMRTNIIRRYFMLTFSYKFRDFGK